MANLLGQNIGTNYKGILNLNTLNGNLTTTLEAITDGDGNASTLLLSTTLARVSSNLTIGGSTTASARLHVRGDGTNPVFRIESSAGNSFFIINNSGQSLFGSAGANEPYLVNYNGTTTESGSGQSLRIRQRANTGATGNTLIQYWADGLFSGTTSGTAISHEFLSSGFAGAAGNSNYRNATFAYTINNSGAQTGTATGIFLNATETALNGMGHNLMDLQVGGNSQFLVNRLGLSVGGSLANGNISLRRSADNNIQARIETTGSQLVLTELQGSGLRFDTYDSNLITLRRSAVSVAIMSFGGTTNAFPAIKRNGAAIDFRLADDSGFCNINARIGTFSQGTGDPSLIVENTGNTSSDSVMRLVRGVDNLLHYGGNGLLIGGNTPLLKVGNTSRNVDSAIVQIDSTTRGFLPPRLTTTQKNAITTPATGLVLYDSTLNKLCVYTGSAWETITSV
jgi:hypothetical protein